MMYQKPKDISYTQMCIYIDDHIYTNDYDEHLVFEYLYHITIMLAKKYKYFNKMDDYDAFGIYAATHLFMRLIDPRQFEENSGKISIPIIKSILNYTKAVMYPMKVDYQQKFYAQNIEKESLPETQYNFNYLISKEVSNLEFADFEMTLLSISSTCRHFLKTIPYPQNSKEWHNIYLSVMLTFLSQITLRNDHLKRIEHLRSTERLRDYHFDIFYRECKSDIILYHLPESMRNYIDVLTRQLNNILAKDLCNILDTKVHTDYLLLNNMKEEFLKESMNQDVDP